MSESLKNIDELLCITEDRDFVIACYDKLLQRPCSLGDLANALTLIENGMQRDAYIGSILSSPEFANRFSVEGAPSALAALRKYTHPNKIEKIIRSNEGHTDTNNNKIISIAFDFPTDDISDDFYSESSDLEFDSLRNCQIDILRQFLASEYGDSLSDFSYYGDYASILLDGGKPFNEDNNSTQNLLCTAPDDLDFILNSSELTDTASRITDSMLFTMPVVPYSDKAVSVIWDKHWHSFDSLSPAMERSVTGSDNASLFLMNNTDSFIQAKISFDIISFNRDASMIIRQNQNNRMLALDRTYCHVSLDLFLKPGFNALGLQYVGLPFVSHITGMEPVRFIIRDLCLVVKGFSLGDTFGSISGKEAYEFDTMTLGNGFYPYIMSDQQIRFALHENGFFEVKCVRFFNDYTVKNEMTTRYLEYRYGDLDKNYQVHKDGEDTTYDDNKKPSVRLYIAKRTGRID